MNADFCEAGKGQSFIMLHSTVSGIRQWRRLVNLLYDHHGVMAAKLLGYGSFIKGFAPLKNYMTLNNFVQVIFTIIAVLMASPAAASEVKIQDKYMNLMGAAAWCGGIYEALSNEVGLSHDDRQRIRDDKELFLVLAGGLLMYFRPTLSVQETKNVTENYIKALLEKNRVKIYQAILEPKEISRCENLRDWLSKMFVKKGTTHDIPALTISPLTRAEINGLRQNIMTCLAKFGDNPANVTVSFEMLDNGKVVTGSIKLVSGKNGSEKQIKKAFQSVRRAIERCQGDGYDLPFEKYLMWRSVEMEF